MFAVLFSSLFIYSYYNSRFDSASSIGQVYPDDAEDLESMTTPAGRHIATVASTVAKTLYKLSTGLNDTGDIEMSGQEVRYFYGESEID